MYVYFSPLDTRDLTVLDAAPLEGVTERLGVHLILALGDVQCPREVREDGGGGFTGILPAQGIPSSTALSCARCPRSGLRAWGLNMSMDIAPMTGRIISRRPRTLFWAYCVWNDTLPTYTSSTFERSWTLDFHRQCSLHQALRTFYMGDDFRSALYGRYKIGGRPYFKQNLHVIIRDSDTPMPYSLLHYPDITPLEGSEERQMGPYEALCRYIGIDSGSAQVAGEVESGIRSALPLRPNQVGMPNLPPPGFTVSGSGSGPPIPHEDQKPE